MRGEVPELFKDAGKINGNRTMGMDLFVERAVRALMEGKLRPGRSVRRILGDQIKGLSIQAKIEPQGGAAAEPISIKYLEIIHHLASPQKALLS
jgi:hypothetical protein